MSRWFAIDIQSVGQSQICSHVLEKVHKCFVNNSLRTLYVNFINVAFVQITNVLSLFGIQRQWGIAFHKH